MINKRDDGSGKHVRIADASHIRDTCDCRAGESASYRYISAPAISYTRRADERERRRRGGVDTEGNTLRRAHSRATNNGIS